MIKKITLLVVVIGVCFLAYNLTYKTVISYSAGAPGKYTGSPGDAANCTMCHNPTATNVTGWITSNIPVSGYVPGTTYTITATATDNATNTFGFEISPQLTSGNPLGQMQGMLIVTDISGTKLVSTTGTSDNKYITHKAAGTTGSNNTKTWTFDWQAPSVTPKNVTFYGAFVAGTSTSTDHTYLSSLSYVVNGTGLTDAALADFLGLSIYPNPSTTNATVNMFSEKAVTLNMQLFDISGKQVRTLAASEKFSGSYMLTIPVNTLNTGIYFLKVDIDGKSCYKKMIVG